MERSKLYSGRLVPRAPGNRLGPGDSSGWSQGLGHIPFATSSSPNISSTEQWLSLVGGAAMVGLGLFRGRSSGFLLAGIGASLLYRGATRHCHLYEALGVDTSEHTDAMAVPAQQGYRVEKTITVARPAEHLYRYWRNLENLPRIMRHLRRVERIDDRVSRWVADGPLGTTVQWKAEVINERPDEMIAWRSLEDSQIQTAGSVHFVASPDGGATDVRVNLKYNPPAGKLGANIAALFGSGLEQQLDEDLARFKREMESSAM